MANQVEIPNDLILPEPRDEHERQVYNNFRDWATQVRIALEKINELLP